MPNHLPLSKRPHKGRAKCRVCGKSFEKFWMIRGHMQEAHPKHYGGSKANLSERVRTAQRGVARPELRAAITKRDVLPQLTHPTGRPNGHAAPHRRAVAVSHKPEWEVPETPQPVNFCPSCGHNLKGAHL